MNRVYTWLENTTLLTDRKHAKKSGRVMYGVKWNLKAEEKLLEAGIIKEKKSKRTSEPVHTKKSSPSNMSSEGTEPQKIVTHQPSPTNLTQNDEKEKKMRTLQALKERALTVSAHDLNIRKLLQVQQSIWSLENGQVFVLLSIFCNSLFCRW